MAGWHVFLRGEGKFPAMPCRLFYGAGEMCVMRVGCKINFMCCGDAHLFFGGVFSVFSFQLIKLLSHQKSLVSIKNIVIIYI